ncbi:MAG: ABC transporter permease [Bdellovibrionota bacterium]
MNFFTDVVLHPVVTALIEVTLWLGVFRAMGSENLAGFGRDNYLAYAIWGAFVSRITVTWMYEFRMIEEVAQGSLNNLLVRPLSFFEYYLSQFLGYKAITSVVSLLIPIAATLIFHLPGDLRRLPIVLVFLALYLVLVHTMSFCIACCAFRLNKADAITAAKNLGLWLFSGELFPIDMVPEPFKGIMLALPFSNGVYVPVAYLTGRGSFSLLLHGFATTAYGLLFFGVLGTYLWKSGLKIYTGTGA